MEFGQQAEGVFVKLVRNEIEKNSQVPVPQDAFRWSAIAIPKVNHFVWRAIEGRIPTASALAGRNVTFGDGRCPMCGINDEDADHLLVACSFAKSVWWNICVWNYNMATNRKKVIYSIFLVTLWQIWISRNETIFKGRQASVRVIVDEIKESSMWWLKKRSKLAGFNEQSKRTGTISKGWISVFFFFFFFLLVLFVSWFVSFRLGSVVSS
ncbi:putative reverse transcriptase zinc-binding domain-containing protein [Helianthus anomalus]